MYIDICDTPFRQVWRQNGALDATSSEKLYILRFAKISRIIESFFFECKFASPTMYLSSRKEDIKTTLQTYSHLYPNKQAEVAEKLQGLY